MRESPRTVNRLAQPIKTLAQRFAYLGLVGMAFALMMLGKIDTFLVERARTHVTDAVVPILDAMSRPVASINRLVSDVREIANLREENRRLRVAGKRPCCIGQGNYRSPENPGDRHWRRSGL